VIIEPLHVAGVDDERLFEVRLEVGRQVIAPRLEDLFVTGAFVGHRAMVALGHLT